MPAYIVAYDLYQEGQNYNCLTKKLEAYPTHWHMQRSVWIIVTDQTAMQIHDNLAICIDGNDKLFVGKLDRDAAWSNKYGQKVTDWLQKNL